MRLRATLLVLPVPIDRLALVSCLTSAPTHMKTVRLEAALRTLKKMSEEIDYQTCFEEKNFTAGLIAFRPGKKRDSKQINHADKDVLCHVLRGNGRLRVNNRRIPLRPGMICHIPKGTPHDFAAGERTRLVLFYSLIHTG